MFASLAYVSSSQKRPATSPLKKPAKVYIPIDANTCTYMYIHVLLPQYTCCPKLNAVQLPECILSPTFLCSCTSAGCQTVQERLDVDGILLHYILLYLERHVTYV